MDPRVSEYAAVEGFLNDMGGTGFWHEMYLTRDG
jgi:hypothetical protein